ncbi:MAG: cobyrinate a,c-diamide synthase [Proteobacteria bacterium]|nr:cobyrinate a,c-diamide synthase [Pseudomonadota bacterium]
MRSDNHDFPGIVISALRGGSGKTILSIGIIAALKDGGKKVTPFKKGPDYIDAGWLGLAAGQPCYNLDTFLLDIPTVKHSFYTHAAQSEISIIEGNRGLYDGIDTEGTTSTAETSKLLSLPVILCLDCTKTTRTMAAAVLGCKNFDPEVDIKGVVLNRVAGSRHETILRTNIEYHCGIPVVGSVPKLRSHDFPERHMGLVPTHEHEWATNSINAAAQIAKNHIDLDTIVQIANQAAAKVKPDLHQITLSGKLPLLKNKNKTSRSKQVKIGIFRDSAFQFYYPENLEALSEAGSELVYISPLEDQRMPEDIDGVYVGGGFPETHARELSQNVTFREGLKALAEKGFPIYAECGGLMYMGKKLILEDESYDMTGILPIIFGFSKKPQGHGYTIIAVDKENPFFKPGTEIRGHEFRYSRVIEWESANVNTVFEMKRGTGIQGKRDGISYKRVLATYTHLHALGTPVWAESLIKNAINYQKER